MGKGCYQPPTSNYRLAITAQLISNCCKLSEVLSIVEFLLVQDNDMILGI